MTVVPVAGEEYSFSVTLVAIGGNGVAAYDPTIEEGDFKLSINGGDWENLDNLPVVSPEGSIRVGVTLSAEETAEAGAGGEIWVRWSDQEGEEWFTHHEVLRVYESDIGSPLTASEIAAAVWAYATRTFTQPAVAPSAVNGPTINVVRGDTLQAVITGLGNLTGYVSLDFSVKTGSSVADEDATIRIRLNASGIGGGLLYLNGEQAETPTNGSITINSLPLGNVTIALAADETALLSIARNLVYDVQMIFDGGVRTIALGAAHVVSDVTQAVV